MGVASLTNSLSVHVSQTTPSTNHNSTWGLYLRTSGSSNEAVGYLYFPKPFPPGATILSATITLTNDRAYSSATHILTAQRLNQTFSASKVTWNSRPTSMIAGTKTVTKTGTVAINTEWVFDVADWMQTIANGGAWYGIRLSINESIIRVWYSDNHPLTNYRPRLDIIWSDAPQTPTELSPSGGRAVGLSKPVLKATYRDYSGATQLAALQAQINDTDVWTSPDFDSGTVTTSVPELDLDDTAYGGVANGDTVFWRVRFQDAAGVWSAWSAATSFRYDDKGTLTISSPLYGTPALADNFEGGNPGWVLNANATVAHSTAQAHSGTGSLAITTTNTSTASARHESVSTSGIPVTAGLEYAVDAWFRSAAVARSAFTSVNWWTAAGGFISNTPGVGSTTNTTGWVRVQNLFTAPPTAAFAHVIAAVSTPGAGEVHYVDDVTFTDTATAPVVEDSTPPIAWTFTGETQAAYQIQIRHTENGVTMTDWDSGKVTSTDTTVTVPAGKITNPAGILDNFGDEYVDSFGPTVRTYSVTVRIWDAKSREATPGDPTYVEAFTDFTFTPGAAVGTTSLTAAAGDPRPVVTLTWTRATAPDAFNIVRNGKVIESGLIPEDAFDSGTTYTWVDNSASPRRVLTYEVQAVINGVASATNDIETTTLDTRVTWLREPISGLEVAIFGNDDREFILGEESAVLQSIAQNANKVAINQSLGGLEGRIEGTLENLYDRTAQEWRDQFLQMRALRVKKFWLTHGDYTFQAVCQRFSYSQTATKETRFRVGFDVYQQNSIDTALLGY